VAQLCSTLTKARHLSPDAVLPDSTRDIRPDIHGPGCPGIPIRIFVKFPLAETGTEAVLLPFVMGGILRLILVDRRIADRVGRHFLSQQIVRFADKEIIIVMSIL
jgi:hypothetical protein